MLKIVTVDSQDQRMLVVRGRLVEPWVGELQRTWEQEREVYGGRKLIIDLRAVTALNQHAENILMNMLREGVRLVGGAMITRSVLQHLERRHREETASQDLPARKGVASAPGVLSRKHAAQLS
jgi:anti-anti-sigma regulatory factor